MYPPTEEEYYDLMHTIDEKETFEDIHDSWYKCFSYIMMKLMPGVTEEGIKSIFYHFEMSNWKDLHKENSEYSNQTKWDLVDKFCGECRYISDRFSYDRLFRTHWLFYRAFDDELTKIKYPELYP